MRNQKITHQPQNPVGESGIRVEDPKVPLNVEDIAVDANTPVASPEASSPTPAAPEVKTVSLEEYERQKAEKRQGALFAVGEEDKSKLEAQFKGKPVSFRTLHFPPFFFPAPPLGARAPQRETPGLCPPPPALPPPSPSHTLHSLPSPQLHPLPSPPPFFLSPFCLRAAGGGRGGE